MLAKRVLCTAALLMIAGVLFARSPPFESFSIRNSSSSDVIVCMEFWLGHCANLNSVSNWTETTWMQTISGVPLNIMDWLAWIGTNTIRPNQELTVIEYNAGFRYFDDMVAIPIMGKLNAIFKSIEIIHNNGRSVITLEDLNKIELERRTFMRNVIYTLEIFDLDDVEDQILERNKIYCGKWN